MVIILYLFQPKSWWDKRWNELSKGIYKRLSIYISCYIREVNINDVQKSKWKNFDKAIYKGGVCFFFLLL